MKQTSEFERKAKRVLCIFKNKKEWIIKMPLILDVALYFIIILIKIIIFLIHADYVWIHAHYVWKHA